ncbi:MAG: glycosyltransferase family 2 protein [Eubacterium sp.]|nr:glycosyltransferase family 2 protein [Eubacterium sp.]
MEPLVSIIIPVFNVELYLDQCLTSVIRQTYKHLEIILVDDGSTDTTGELCDKWATIDSRIKVFHQSNSGTYQARIAALRAVSGEYVMFVDGDDYLAENMAELLLQECQKSPYSIASCDYYLDYGDRKTAQAHTTSTVPVTDRCKMLTDNFNSFLWNKMFSATVIRVAELPDLAVNYKEDVLLLHFFFRNAKALYFVHQPLYYYRRRSASLTSNRVKEEYINDISLVLNTLLETEKDEAIKDYYAAILINTVTVLVKNILITGDCIDKIGYMRTW